jgi:hypothetical protein
LGSSRWHTAVIITAAAFSAFSTVHLIDDFLASVPAEFNLGVEVTLLLALAYSAALVGLIAAAASRKPGGYLGLIISGILIALAQGLKSIPEMLQPGPWHLGLPSELAALGLGLSAGLTAVFSYFAWREARSAAR